MAVNQADCNRCLVLVCESSEAIAACNQLNVR
jgi:hypothetical protein